MTELVGQESVWNECINQFHTPTHIFITGPAGYGKTTIMRQFLQTYSKEKKRPNSHLWGLETTDECLLLGPDQDRGIQTIAGRSHSLVSTQTRRRAVGRSWFGEDGDDGGPRCTVVTLA